MRDTVRRHKTLFGALAFLVAIALLGRILDRDEEQGAQVAFAATTTVPATVTTMAATQPDSEVPPVDCLSLLTTEESEAALGISDRAEDQRDSLMSSQAEVCVETLVSDEEYFEGIAPGSPDDFAEGTTLNETTGEPVEIADGGLWFGGEAAGLLSVRKETPLGALHFRVLVGRPDLDDATRRDTAIDLAATAMSRFPGVETETETETEVVAFPDEEPDRSAVSYVDNLLAKLDDGEWTLGEGLVATLRLFAGEAEPEEVLRHEELVDHEGTGIREMAREYLEDGSDAEAKAEIGRLLDVLTFTSEELEGMAGIGPVTAALPGAPESVTAQAEEDCTRLFGEALGVSVCLEVESFVINGKEYRVFQPAPSLPQGGWTPQKFDLAVTAIKESVPKLDTVGTTPRANLVFSVAGTEFAEASYVAGQPCGIFLYTKLQPFPIGNFKQVIAHELGHCFNGETFTGQKDVDYEARK